MQCKWWSSAAILVGMLFVAVQANAAMITYDLDLQDTGGGIIEASASFAPAQVIPVGEVVTIDAQFAPGQALRIDGSTDFETLFLGITSNTNAFSSVKDVTVKLLGFSGTGGAMDTYSAPTATARVFGHELGVVLTDFLTSTQSVTFTGYSVQFTVNSQNPASRSFAVGTLAATNAEITTVPEPSTYAMFGIGALAIGLAAFWKTREKQVAAIA